VTAVPPSQPLSASIAPALELFVDVLAQADADSVGDDFFSRLAGAVCRLTAMRRGVIFHYDDARRRVRAVGAHEVPLDRFEARHVSVEDAPPARLALLEDRVVEVGPGAAQGISPTFAELAGEHGLVYVPIAASGSWIGVIVLDPGVASGPLDPARRDLLWTLGKTLALAFTSRTATAQRQRAHQLEERIGLARDLHEHVVQRLFGVSLALSSEGSLSDEARARCADEVLAALGDLRSALQRPLGRPSRPTGTTLAAELERLQGQHPDLRLAVDGEVAPVPPGIEPLAQSVLAEAVRNARKHAEPERVVVRVQRWDGTFMLEVENDGVGPRRGGQAGMGLRLAALEALNLGGVVEFGPQASGTWLVRLLVHGEPAVDG
jgi:signal transduction histidine kinase